jgi:hypothetical protein
MLCYGAPSTHPSAPLAAVGGGFMRHQPVGGALLPLSTSGCRNPRLFEDVGGVDHDLGLELGSVCWGVDGGGAADVCYQNMWGEYDCVTIRDSRLIRIRTGPNPGQLPNKGSCKPTLALRWSRPTPLTPSYLLLRCLESSLIGFAN